MNYGILASLVLALAAISYIVVVLFVRFSFWVRSGVAGLSVKKSLMELSDLSPSAKEAVAARSRSSVSVLFGLWKFVAPYFQFGGVASRREYFITLGVGAIILGVAFGLGLFFLSQDLGLLNVMGIVLAVASLVVWCGVLATASTRKMRDTGVNPWWTLAYLTPPVNLACAVFLFFVPTNEFSGRGLQVCADPKHGQIGHPTCRL